MDSSMSMTMSMTVSPTSTMSGMSMATSSSDSMGMSSETMMGMDMMAMTFFTSTTTPLFSYSWTPTSTGQYAGTCIFLIAFAAVFRALLAIRVRFYDFLAAVQRRRNGGIIYALPSGEKTSARPWRAREAVMLAVIDMIIAGVAYLLMIAVMTMNVGYFTSVLAGVFVGSFVFAHFMGASAA